MLERHPSMSPVLESMELESTTQVWEMASDESQSEAIKAVLKRLWHALENLDGAFRRQTQHLRAVVAQVEREQANDAKMFSVNPMWIMQSAEQLRDLKIEIDRELATAQMLNSIWLTLKK